MDNNEKVILKEEQIFTEEFQQWLVEHQSDFYQLHVHDEYSNLRLKDSTNKLDKMVEYVANTLHQKGMAITNHEFLGGSVKYIKLMKELREKDEKWKDFKYIIGNEIYLTSKELMEEQRENGSIKFYHFLLLAKDEIGHEQLRQLSSIAWKDNSFNYKNMDRVPTYYENIENVIGDNKGHLVASSGCVGGYLGQSVLRLLNEELTEDEEDKIKDDIFDFLEWCKNTFGEDNFYIELQPSEQEDYYLVNEYILRIAKACEIPFIFTTDAHYLNKEERLIHKAFLTSSDDEGSGAREVDSFYGTTYFMDVFELCDYLNYLDENDLKEGILNTKKIADSIEEYDLYHPQIVPKVPVPNENTWYYNETLYNFVQRFEYIKKMIESDEIQDRYLANLTLKGFEEKTLKNTVNNLTINDKIKHLERIDIEFKEILGGSEIKGDCVSAYFVTEKTNVDIIWEEAEAILGTSRGSCMGFITNYYLGISQVSPLDHNEGLEMPHWRFITADRLELDFPRP